MRLEFPVEVGLRMRRITNKVEKLVAKTELAIT